MRTFGLTPDYVIHDLSYANLILYGASQPVYRRPEENKDTDGMQNIYDMEIDGDDPAMKDVIAALLG